MSRYGFFVDDRAWDRFDEVFVADAQYDCRDFGGPLCASLEELRDFFSSTPHPVAHHVTNIVIDSTGEATATARSKFIVPRADGTTGTGEYADQLVRTPAGWRITRRRATLRSERPPHLRSR